MSQTIEVSTREEQIREVLPIFEDRLRSPRPEAGSWEELSAMLGPEDSPLRREMSLRREGQDVWQRFLEWEQGHKTAAAPGRFAPFPGIRRREHQGLSDPEAFEAGCQAGCQAGIQAIAVV